MKLTYKMKILIGIVANSPNSDFEIDFYLRKTLRTQNWLSFQPVWAKSPN